MDPTSTAPKTFREASKISVWREAMDEEYRALLDQKTWRLVSLPTGRQAIDTKWIYKIKEDSNGGVARYKARLVARGFLQEEGLDYTETFSPVAKMATVRLLISVAVSFNWIVNQFDISNAFLHGTIDEEIYVKQPSGYANSNSSHLVCRLNKALYGLKQAPRAWFSTFSSSIMSLGFKQSIADTSLFIPRTAHSVIYLLLYVDDILITGNDSGQINFVVSQLRSRFKLKELGELNYFLGISVNRSSEGCFLSQSKYAGELLQRAGLKDCNTCSSPRALPTNVKTDHTPYENPSMYRSIVGGLQYLTITRPDIAFCVNSLCQNMASPTNENYLAAKRVLRYVKGMLKYGLSYKKSSLNITAFSDSDWAGSTTDRKSTTGFCVYVGTNLISWTSKKQPTVARSSTEAEYRSMASAAVEITWIQMLLRDLQLPSTQRPILYCDNISSIALASNPIFHARTKHIEVDYHFVREKVMQRAIDVRHVSTTHQIADILTKPLASAKFRELHIKLHIKLHVQAPTVQFAGEC